MSVAFLYKAVFSSSEWMPTLVSNLQIAAQPSQVFQVKAHFSSPHSIPSTPGRALVKRESIQNVPADLQDKNIFATFTI